ncbi:hypothetical protein Aduo_010018 [Ancylostoma duodenale]
MRSLQIIFIILALHLRGSSADLWSWANEAWRFTKESTGKTWHFIKTTAEKVWNDAKTGKAWQFVKKNGGELVERVKSKINRTVASAREYAESDWNCGADKFWPSKLYIKLLTSAICLELKGE